MAREVAGSACKMGLLDQPRVMCAESEQPVSEAVRPPETLKEQVVRIVRQRVEAGELRDGEALPPTRALAESMGVSVFTISEAMKELGSAGYVENHKNSRRVIRNPNTGTAPSRLTTTQPTVVFVGGYAGSGKTEFGKVLARLTRWPILDKDTTTRPVVECALAVLDRPEHDRESDVYLEQIRPREYEALQATAIENIECGVSAIITAPFLREVTSPAWLARTTALFESRGARVEFVWLRCDLDTMKTYIRHRGAARDTGKIGNWETYSAEVNTEFAPSVPHTIIENGAHAEPLRPQAERFIASLTQAKTAP